MGEQGSSLEGVPPPIPQVGQYLGAFEDIVVGNQVTTSVARVGKAQDEEVARTLLENEGLAHSQFKNGLRNVKVQDDHTIADSIVQNPMETDAAPPPAFVRSLLKDMQRKATEGEALEKELLETTRQKSETERHTPMKRKQLWREKMALTTEEMRLKKKHESWLDDMKVMQSLIKEEFSEASSQDMGESKDECLASWAKVETEAAQAIGNFDTKLKAMHASWASVLSAAKTLESCEAAQTLLKDQDSECMKDIGVAKKLATQKLVECKSMVASLTKQLVQRAHVGDSKVSTKRAGAQALAAHLGLLASLGRWDWPMWVGAVMLPTHVGQSPSNRSPTTLDRHLRCRRSCLPSSTAAGS